MSLSSFSGRKFFRHLLRLCRQIPLKFLSSWRQWLNWRMGGIVPLHAYVVTLVCLSIFLAIDELSSEISVMFAALTVFGVTCAELGGRIPILRRIGGPVIVTTLLPSYLVYHQFLPAAFVQAIKDFWQTTNILYLFTAVVIVGSILSMPRQVLIGGCAKIFIPLAAGSVAAALVGTLTGMFFGNSAYDTFFYTVIPIMAGGLGEGAIPLTLGYAELMQLPQKQLFAQVVPSVVLGNLIAIVCAAVLHQYGKHSPQYSNAVHLPKINAIAQGPLAVESWATAGIVALSFYMFGIVLHSFTGLPAPLGMLFFAVLIRLVLPVSPQLEHSSQEIYHFFARVVTYPLLFGIGVTLTPWDSILAALTLAHLVTIIATVFTLIAIGFLVGRWIGLSPIESAIINACHSGMGSIGDLSILTAAHRLDLMAFAQLATRIGGAVTVVLALFILSFLV